MTLCSIPTCQGEVKAKHLCNKHYHKLRKYGDPLFGYEEKNKKGEGSFRENGYHRKFMSGKEKLEHVLIAESVIGKALPKGACVHHIDGNPHNNANSNLVICQSQAYHMLIHQRQAALEAIGNADWRACNICKKYNAPENLYISMNFSTVYHRACKAEYSRQRKAIKHKEQTK